jgi:starch-binding outer membrane protein SusE/F
MTGSSYVYNGGGNISVAADGYYTITLNSITNTLTIVSASAPTASYTSIGLIGGFNSWGSDVIMTPAQTTNNHIWYTTQTFATDGGCKFRADGAWTTSWGGDSFPIGMSGGDIPAKAGTYKVLFNDIDGCFYFIKQ